MEGRPAEKRKASPTKTKRSNERGYLPSSYIPPRLTFQHFVFPLAWLKHLKFNSMEYWLPSLVAHAAIEAASPARACICSFQGSSPAAEVLEVLERQLERCKSVGYGLPALLVALWAGALLGAAACRVWLILRARPGGAQDGSGSGGASSTSPGSPDAREDGVRALLRRSRGHMARAPVVLPGSGEHVGDCHAR